MKKIYVFQCFHPLNLTSFLAVLQVVAKLLGSFHDLFERDCSLDANLHKTQILNDKVTSREL